MEGDECSLNDHKVTCFHLCKLDQYKHYKNTINHIWRKIETAINLIHHWYERLALILNDVVSSGATKTVNCMFTTPGIIYLLCDDDPTHQAIICLVH